MPILTQVDLPTANECPLKSPKKKHKKKRGHDSNGTFDDKCALVADEPVVENQLEQVKSNALNGGDQTPPESPVKSRKKKPKPKDGIPSHAEVQNDIITEDGPATCNRTQLKSLKMKRKHDLVPCTIDVEHVTAVDVVAEITQQEQPEDAQVIGAENGTPDGQVKSKKKKRKKKHQDIENDSEHKDVVPADGCIPLQLNGTASSPNDTETNEKRLLEVQKDHETIDGSQSVPVKKKRKRSVQTDCDEPTDNSSQAIVLEQNPPLRGDTEIVETKLSKSQKKREKRKLRKLQINGDPKTANESQPIEPNGNIQVISDPQPNVDSEIVNEIQGKSPKKKRKRKLQDVSSDANGDGSSVKPADDSQTNDCNHDSLKPDDSQPAEDNQSISQKKKRKRKLEEVLSADNPAGEQQENSPASGATGEIPLKKRKKSRILIGNSCDVTVNSTGNSDPAISSAGQNGQAEGAAVGANKRWSFSGTSEVPVKVASEDGLQSSTPVPQRPAQEAGKARAKSEPFRRVRSEQVQIDQRLASNSFFAKSGAAGSWGERANHDLMHTRGKGFRHEKTKKKRGSYCGGLIDTTVHSIKFDY